MAFFTGKNGYTRPVDFVPVHDPTRKTSTDTRGYGSGTGIPAGTGRPAHLYNKCKVVIHT